MSPINTLAQLIAQVESDGNQYGIRIEPHYQPKLANIKEMMALCKCNYDTAQALCQMSWGLYQIMGENLIVLGLSITPFEYLESPAIQAEFFDAYCESDHLNLTLEDVLTNASKRQLFARLYNGPGNVPEYVQRIISVAKANGLEIS